MVGCTVVDDLEGRLGQPERLRQQRAVRKAAQPDFELEHLGDGDDLGARTEQSLVFAPQHLARVVHRDDADVRAVLGRQWLPGHDVGVTLQVAGDDLVGRGCTEELRHLVACAHMGIGGPGGQFMCRTVDVAVLGPSSSPPTNVS